MEWLAFLRDVDWTALGVVGAAAGYLINLIKSWREESRGDHDRGTKFVILELLERNLWSGLSDDELFTLYGVHESEETLQKYGAWKPSELTRLSFEKLLKQLQVESMIDPAAKDLYRIRIRPLSSYELSDANRSQAIGYINGHFSKDEIAQVAKRVLSNTSEPWEIQSALEILVTLGDPSAKDVIQRGLSSDEIGRALATAKVVSQFMVAAR